MTVLLAIYAGLVLLLGGYTLAALPASGWRRYAAPALLAALYVAVLAAGAQALGRPRPVGLDVPQRTEARLIAMSWHEGEAIWLWLAVPWSTEPVAYALPWSEEQAAQLYGVQQQAEAEGGEPMVEIEVGAQWLAGERVRGYARPQPPEPPKEQ